MQHNLATQYELAWSVADMVATHGRHDFVCVDGSVRKVVSLCGLTVVYENMLPISFDAPDMQLRLDRTSGTVLFDKVLAGSASEMMHDVMAATYTLSFDRGDLTTLYSWRDRLTTFMTATAVRKAA